MGCEVRETNLSPLPWLSQRARAVWRSTLSWFRCHASRIGCAGCGAVPEDGSTPSVIRGVAGGSFKESINRMREPGSAAGAPIGGAPGRFLEAPEV